MQGPPDAWVSTKTYGIQIAYKCKPDILTTSKEDSETIDTSTGSRDTSSQSKQTNSKSGTSQHPTTTTNPIPINSQQEQQQNAASQVSTHRNSNLMKLLQVTVATFVFGSVFTLFNVLPLWEF